MGRKKGYLAVENSLGMIKIHEKYNNIKEAKSRTKQNFENIVVLPVEFKGKKYIGLGVKKTEGRYEYPTIHEDYYVYDKYHFYVFEAERLRDFENLNGKAIITAILYTSSNYGETAKKYKSCYDHANKLFKERDGKNEEEWLKDISKLYEFYITKTMSEGVEVIRFLLPHGYKNKSYKYYRSYKDTRIDFEKHYFEISIEQYQKLIDLMKEITI